MARVRWPWLIATAALALASLAFVGGLPWAALLLAGCAGATATRLRAAADAAAPPPAAEAAAVEPPAPPSPILIDAIDDPILLVHGRRVSEANAAARALLGEHIVGEDARIALRHPAAAASLAEAEGGAQGASVELAGVGERDRRWELLVRRIDAGTRIVRLVDRTRAHASERMRTDFVANASHELRTPLATIIGAIETVEDADRPDDAPVRARFLRVMMGEARRMQRLIDDLLSLSRIEVDKYRAPAERVALGKLAAEVADAMRGAADPPPTILIRADHGAPDAAGDRAQLSQLLYNLVGNALKYGAAGGPVTIDIAARAEAMVALSVSDTGDGIAPEHLPRLTERFYRVDPGRSRAGGGTGLGLAIVKHIVERHRGRLAIASAPGQGTTVTVLLPQAPDAALAPDTKVQHIAAMGAATPPVSARAAGA